MAINFTRLFTSLGLVCGGLNEINTYRGTTVEDRRDDLVTQFGTVEAYGELVSGLYATAESAAQAENGYVSALSTLAESILIAEVVADRPLTVPTKSAAVKELRRQMLIASETLNDCPGTVTVAAVGVPVGDTQFVFGTREPATGLPTDFLVPDVYLITCTADRSDGGTAHAETFTVVGKPADSLPTDASYPSGTGINTVVTAVDPESDGGIVTVPDFTSVAWSGTGNNTPPAPWAVFGSTVAGTHVFRATTNPRGGSGYSLHLVGDGSVLVKVRQAVTVEPNTCYTAHFRVYDVNDPGTDWAVSLLLTDSAGTSVTGNGSYANVVSSAAAGSLAASWANPVTGVFLTPAVIPSGGLYLEIRLHQSGSLSTAAANTAAAYVNFVSVQESPTDALYDGGPSLVAFSGITEANVGDTRTATVALASGVPSSYLIRGIDRLIGLAELPDRIPTVSGGGETQGDALVV